MTLDIKSIGVILVAVGGMILVSNISTNRKIDSIEARVSHIEEEVLVQEPAKTRWAPKSETDLECLARNVFYEAGVESRLGKYAVAQVTLNRWQFSNVKSICQIIYAKTFTDRWICQFSWACAKVLERPSGPNWEDSKKVAYDVLYNGIRVKPLEEATHYHTVNVKPLWADTAKLVWADGLHLFYAGAKIIITQPKRG